MKIIRTKSDLSYVNNSPCVTVYIFFKTDDNDKMTACGQFTRDEDEEYLLVYDGFINTEDPGEDPEEEYSSCEEALDGEYHEVFETMFKEVAAKLMIQT